MATYKRKPHIVTLPTDFETKKHESYQHHHRGKLGQLHSGTAEKYVFCKKRSEFKEDGVNARQDAACPSIYRPFLGQRMACVISHRV